MDIGNGVSVWVTVRAEEEEPTVQIVATKPYLDRTATGVYSVPDGDPALLAIRDALADLRERYTSKAVQAAEVSAARSLVAAVDYMREVEHGD